MKQHSINVQLTSDDLAWASNKLNSHYAMIKKSDVLTDEEKNLEISNLASRALRFGLRECVSRFGYMIHDILLTEGKEAQLMLPKNHTKEDIEEVEHAIDLRFTAMEIINSKTQAP